MKEYLIKSLWYGNYSRGFSSVEIVSQDTLDKLNKLKSESFSFYVGGWEGKHSEMEMTIDENDFVVVSEELNDIISFKRMFGDHVGNINYSDYVLEKAYESGIFDDEGDDVE